MERVFVPTCSGHKRNVLAAFIGIEPISISGFEAGLEVTLVPYCSQIFFTETWKESRPA